MNPASPPTLRYHIGDRVWIASGVNSLWLLEHIHRRGDTPLEATVDEWTVAAVRIGIGMPRYEDDDPTTWKITYSLDRPNKPRHFLNDVYESDLFASCEDARSALSQMFMQAGHDLIAKVEGIELAIKEVPLPPEKTEP